MRKTTEKPYRSKQMSSGIVTNILRNSYKEIKKEDTKLKRFKIVLFVIGIIIILTPPAFAYQSGRPPSVFSECYCEKEGEDDKQVTFECALYDENNAPENTVLYPGNAFDCPSSLTLKRYKNKKS